jgi:hypothetical protein
MSRYNPPELLAVHHQLAGFRCRSEEQTAWLVEMAKQAHGTGTRAGQSQVGHSRPGHHHRCLHLRSR